MQLSGNRGMQAVTISRQYGSGGGEIAARLASHLGWQLIDHAIVIQAAEEAGIPAEKAGNLDERRENFVERVFHPITVVSPTPGQVRLNSYVLDKLGDEAYQQALQEIVETAAEGGRVVIVGRASQAVLAGWPDVLHVRVVAPLQARIAYVGQREGLDANRAANRIQVKDRTRSRFLEKVYRQRVDDPELYDLIINTGRLSLDGAVELIVQALNDKAQSLSIPTEELGPGRGLERYVGQPGNLRLSQN